MEVKLKTVQNLGGVKKIKVAQEGPMTTHHKFCIYKCMHAHTVADHVLTTKAKILGHVGGATK